MTDRLERLAYQWRLLTARLEGLDRHDPRYWSTREARIDVTVGLVEGYLTWVDTKANAYWAAAERVGSTPSTIARLYREGKNR